MQYPPVFVGYPVGHITPEFHSSLVNLLLSHQDRGIRIVAAHYALPTSMIPMGRNQIVEAFLASGCEWLWFVDTDQVFPPDTLERLLASADPVDRPVVGALTFTLDEQTDMVLPNLWSWHGEDRWPARWLSWPEGLVQVGATGTGCLLVHREVFKRRSRGDWAWPWFAYESWRSLDGMKPLGEDLAWMRLLHGADVPVHVDTRIVVGHRKGWTLTEKDFRVRAEAGRYADWEDPALEAAK